MHLYLDAEFTNFQAPALISFGVVAENGESFYRELRFDPAVCSTFVEDTVLPLLDGEPTSQAQAAADFLLWMGQFSAPKLVFDFPGDGDLVCSLLQSAGQSVPPMLLVECSAEGAIDFENAIDAYFDRSPGEARHHALSDARALRFACNELAGTESLGLVSYPLEAT